MRTIYCDLDGVIADFVSGAIEACDLPIAHDDVKTWNFFKPYMNEYEFWRRIHEQKYFWEDLPVYTWANELVRSMSRFGNVVFCTDPSHDDEAATGKIRWLKRHGFIKPDGKNYILTAEKWRLAKPGDVLVDDSEVNCMHFCGSGGFGIVFPQPWNSAGAGRHRIFHVEDVLLTLEEVANG